MCLAYELAHLLATVLYSAFLYVALLPVLMAMIQRVAFTHPSQ